MNRSERRCLIQSLCVKMLLSRRYDLLVSPYGIILLPLSELVVLLSKSVKEVSVLYNTCLLLLDDDGIV